MILRGGQVVASYTRAEFSPQEMARDLVGQTLVPVERQPPAQKTEATEHSPAKPCLVVRDLRVTHEGVARLDGICFDLFRRSWALRGSKGTARRSCAGAGGAVADAGWLGELYDQDLLPMTTHQRREAGLTWSWRIGSAMAWCWTFHCVTTCCWAKLRTIDIACCRDGSMASACKTPHRICSRRLMYAPRTRCCPLDRCRVAISKKAAVCAGPGASLPAGEQAAGC